MTGPVGPIVLVGNRMLGIMALAVAAAALSPVAERFGSGRFAVAAVAAVVGALVLVRRVELTRAEVRWRTVARHRSRARHELADVELDHRFLRFRPRGGRTIRIEVPAELRPEVRHWVEGGDPSPPATA